MEKRILEKLATNETLNSRERLVLFDWFSENAAKKITRLSQISYNAGDLVAGRFIAPAPNIRSTEPTDTTFTGSFMSGKGETFGGAIYNTGGVNLGTLQWGAKQTDGKLYAGAGNVVIDVTGVYIANNQQGAFGFVDTGGNKDKLIMYSDANDAIGIINKIAGKAIIFTIKTTDLSTPYIKWFEDPGVANGTLLDIGVGTGGGKIALGGQTAFPIQNTESVLGSAFSITGAAGVFQDTGLSVTLPAAGTYRITANARGSLTPNGGAGSTIWWLVVELYNSTDTVVVANSERMCVLTQTNASNLQMTTVIDQIVTVAATKTIKLYAARNGNGTPAWSVSTIESNSAGRTVLSYEKIG